MNLRLFLLPLSLTLAALAVGCGEDDASDSGSEEANVLATVDGFYADVVAGDGDGACGALSDEAIEQVEAQDTGSLGAGLSCAELVEQLAGLFNDEAKEAVSQVEPEVKELNADAAVVETTAINQESLGAESELQESTIELELEKTGDEWKIANFPAG